MRFKNHVNNIIQIPVCDNLIKWSHWIKLYVNYEKENQNCSLQNQKAIIYVFWGGVNKNQTREKMMLIVA